MENPSNSERWNRTGIDDNILAMFDASETKDAHQDTLADRTKSTFSFSFLFNCYIWFVSPIFT